MYRFTVVYIRNIILDEMSILLLEHLALPGRGYAELRLNGVLGSS
jgi:hypothetical protein